MNLNSYAVDNFSTHRFWKLKPLRGLSLPKKGKPFLDYPDKHAGGLPEIGSIS
jgi:hypothetical protein